MVKISSISLQNRFLVERTQNWFDDYQYFGIGTGTVPNSGTETDLLNPVQIGTIPDNRNILFSSGSTSFITAGSTGFIHLFKLNTLQPNTLPVNIKELGMFKTASDNNDMSSRHVLNVIKTKDNTAAWNIRFSGRVSRIN